MREASSEQPRPSSTVSGYPHAEERSLADSLRQRKISGAAFCAARKTSIDSFLSALFHEQFPEKTGLALLALGGYGRGELCPASDIDILFLSDGALAPENQSGVEKILYALWDTGLRVNHACRSLGDCRTLADADAKVMTGLLDARTVAGDAALETDIRGWIAALPEDRKRAFLTAKLEERDARHARYGDTRFVLEPNIKEGKGGLRDYQTLLWITGVLYGASSMKDLAEKGILTDEEARKFTRAHDFLLTVRCHLHDLAGRPEERLHFDIQPDLAERLGYRASATARAVERFMKHYFLVTRDIGDLTRIILAAILHDGEDGAGAKSYLGFSLAGGRLAFDANRSLKKHPLDMLRLFHLYQQGSYDIHPSAMKEMRRNLRFIDADVRQNDQANSIFLDILTTPKNTGQTLRRMSEAGLLGRFVPDFGRVTAMMQFDRYHHYTVDEHTLHCIDIMNRLRDGHLREEAPLSTEAAVSVTQTRALYTALFLHDICKGRGGKHAELGAELALSICPRFGLSGDETDLVSWLVLEHLLMSDTAFRRNLNDPKTIADFSAKVRRPERLDLLFALTTADIMGVGPGLWTAWKARLLEELYLKTKALMAGEEPGMIPDLTLPDGYKTGETRIDIGTDEGQSASVVMVYTPDRPGLFATLCGALSAEGANIMRAYIGTLDGGTAADRFVIQNAAGLPFHQERRQDDLRDAVTNALAGKLDIAAGIATYRTPLTRKDLVFDIAAKVSLDNVSSGTDTVIEIEARDRHGLLYDIARCLGEQGLDIRAAKINTQGLRAIDSFYVRTSRGKKLTDDKLQKKLVMALQAIG